MEEMTINREMYHWRTINMFIITGLGRCGTSILTKYLGEVGFGLGHNVNWNAEMRAGLELSTAYAINREIHQAYCMSNKPIDLEYPFRGNYWKCTYREAIQNVDKDERQGKVDVFKDPRFTWNPALVEAWWSVRQDIKFIICHRKIEDVYKSRKAMLPHQDDPKRKELAEYKIDFADFFTCILELKIPYCLLYFPNFLFDFDGVHYLLNDIGLEHNYDKGKKVWDELIDTTPYEEPLK